MSGPLQKPQPEHVIDAWPPAILLVFVSLIAIIVWNQLTRCR